MGGNPGVRARGGAPSSFQFSKEERAKIEADFSGALRGIEAMRRSKIAWVNSFRDGGSCERSSMTKLEMHCGRSKKRSLNHYLRVMRARENLARELAI